MVAFPFGNPDGSRSSLNEILEDFVEFDRLKFGPGLGLMSDELDVRVIVGAKGSGKTVYLRRLQDAATQNKSLYADLLQQDLPDTNNIVKFCELYPHQYLSEKWERLWYCAILTSLCTHLLYHRELADRLALETREKLRKQLPENFPFETPVSVYSELTDIIRQRSTQNQFDKYFDSPNWPQLEFWLGQALKDMPPIYFFLDSIDDKYDKAPMHWLECQTGLFQRTMRFLRDFALGGRFHVVIGIRDHVLASAYRSEHQNKFRGEPHIRLLDWNFDAIEFLLYKKIERLNENYLMKPQLRKSSPMEAWLGTSTVENVSRHIIEQATHYLLRHTTLYPRDIVRLGNLLSQEVLRARAGGHDIVPQAAIRRCVSQIAKDIASEQLTVCANQIASSGMPPSAGRKEFTEVYVGDNEYVRSLADHIKEVIASIGKDRFTSRELYAASLRAKQIFGDTSDVFTVLWLNRLLGYRTTARVENHVRFFSENSHDSFTVPANQHEYVFHPCLIDAVGIRATGSLPPHQWQSPEE